MYPRKLTVCSVRVYDGSHTAQMVKGAKILGVTMDKEERIWLSVLVPSLETDYEDRTFFSVAAYENFEEVYKDQITYIGVCGEHPSQKFIFEVKKFGN